MRSLWPRVRDPARRSTQWLPQQRGAAPYKSALSGGKQESTASAAALPMVVPRSAASDAAHRTPGTVAAAWEFADICGMARCYCTASFTRARLGR